MKWQKDCNCLQVIILDCGIDMIFIQSSKSRYVIFRAMLAYQQNPNIKIYVLSEHMRNILLQYIPAENLVSTREEEKMNDIWWEEAE